MIILWELQIGLEVFSQELGEHIQGQATITTPSYRGFALKSARVWDLQADTAKFENEVVGICIQAINENEGTYENCLRYGLSIIDYLQIFLLFFYISVSYVTYS